MVLLLVASKAVQREQRRAAGSVVPLGCNSAEKRVRTMEAQMVERRVVV